MGLAAAITLQRACSDVTMPALEIEMLCCSMACAQRGFLGTRTKRNTCAAIWCVLIHPRMVAPLACVTCAPCQC